MPSKLLRTSKRLSVGLSLAAILSGCASVPASDSVSCMTLGTQLPICYDQYTKDGVREDTDTEYRILLMNEWFYSACNNGVPTCE